MICTALYVMDKNSLLQRFKPRHEDIYGSHSTIAFNPQKGIENITIGKTHTIKILGEVFDKKCYALLVENIMSENRFPHITISCESGLDPYYANKLLEESYERDTILYFEDTILVSVVEGCYDGDLKREFR